MMIIGLKSGKVFECDDMSYTEFDKYSGETTRIFINIKNEKKYTVSESAIEFWEEEIDSDEIEALMMWCDDDEFEGDEEEIVGFG